MINKPSCILLDTNIWLDNYLGSRRSQIDSRALIDRCQDLEIDLLISPFSVRDVYYQVAQDLKRNIRKGGGTVDQATAATVEEIAWKTTLNLLELGTVVPIDQSDLAVARYYHQVHRDFEDDLILAAIKRADADYLVTNDELLAKRSPLATISAHDMVVLLNDAEEV